MAADEKVGRDNRSTAQAEFEDTIRSIYYYQQSYFRADKTADGIFPKLSYKDTPPSSENYCIDTLWKSKDDVLNLGFSDADDQPPCDNGVPVDDDVGLSFQLYLWQPSEAFTCKLGPACEFNCNIFGGKFNTDDGNCYELKALKKLCVKVDFKYYDD